MGKLLGKIRMEELQFSETEMPGFPNISTFAGTFAWAADCPNPQPPAVPLGQPLCTLSSETHFHHPFLQGKPYLQT